MFGSIVQNAYDVLGYEPEDVVGRPGYELMSSDHANIKDFRKEYFKNDLIASQAAIRLKRKDGVFLSCVMLGSLCYDFAVAIITILDSGVEASLQRRAHSTAMNGRTGYKEEVTHSCAGWIDGRVWLVSSVTLTFKEIIRREFLEMASYGARSTRMPHHQLIHPGSHHHVRLFSVRERLLCGPR
ncbi:hypothetical protein B0O80DRAFT_461877 [Mortierella sp. GBAus27b]|nr:hypothetical protein B0O80DRAFT_461877 [Mortierella sp. GBAus27b]